MGYRQIQGLMKSELTVPNGRVVSGYRPGGAAISHLEHELRDELARQVGGLTEANLGYGRADVLTSDRAFEVEPWKQWRHAVRQSLQYSSQTGCRPVVALFGAASCHQVLATYLKLRDGHPPIELWWHNHYWREITSRVVCRAVVA